MNSELVSVVLPVYNGEKYIRESINSVINQTYDNWELIIVDDCSTDNTLNIIKEYEHKDPRIRVIHNKTNKKLPASLNVGFSNTKGEFLTWTSDDNVYKQDALLVMKNYLTVHKNISFVYANYTKINEKGEFVKKIEVGEPEELYKRNVCGACFLYTREIYQKVGDYDINSFLAEDYDYWLRINIYGEIAHIKDNLYCYRSHGNSLTKTKKEEIRVQTLKVLLKNRNGLIKKSKRISKFWLNEQILKYANENEKNNYMNSFIKEDYLFFIYNILNVILKKK